MFVCWLVDWFAKVCCCQVLHKSGMASLGKVGSSAGLLACPNAMWSLWKSLQTVALTVCGILGNNAHLNKSKRLMMMSILFCPAKQQHKAQIPQCLAADKCTISAPSDHSDRYFHVPWRSSLLHICSCCHYLYLCPCCCLQELQAMGIVTPFTDQVADFSRMSKDPLYISDILQSVSQTHQYSGS